MEKPDQTEAPECIEPKFQFNRSALKMLLLCAGALALPVALAVLGFSGMKGKSQAQTAETAAPQTDSFRGALESIADEKLPKPTLDTGARRFVFEKSEKFEETSQAIQKLLRSPEVIAVSTDDSNFRWIVQVPSNSVGEFDQALSLLKPVAMPNYPIQDKNEKMVFYEIKVQRSP
jgi:hypothetical protein